MSAVDEKHTTEDFVEHLNKTFWLESCCCCGAGCISPDVICEGQKKFCCMQTFVTSGEEACGSTGCIVSSGKGCCLVHHAKFPPDTCRFAICNMFCIGEAPGQAEEMAQRDSDALNESFMADSFWLIYTCCQGYGCTSAGDPMCQGQSKFLCLFSKMFTTECAGERGCINGHFKVCCFSEYQTFPPNITPGIGCCNMMCCGDNRNDFARTPTQMEMPASAPPANVAAPGGPQLAQGFLNALWGEYVLRQENGVGNFFQACPPELAQTYESFENTVRSAPDSAGAIRGLAMQWGLPPPQ